MHRTKLPTAAITLVLGAFGLGLIAPNASAVTAGSAPIVTPADPNIQLAYVKKKVVVKKKGYKKTTTVYTKKKSYKPRSYSYAYGLGYYYPRYTSCRSVVKYVKYRNPPRTVRTVRRVC